MEFQRYQVASNATAVSAASQSAVSAGNPGTTGITIIGMWPSGNNLFINQLIDQGIKIVTLNI